MIVITKNLKQIAINTQLDRDQPSSRSGKLFILIAIKIAENPEKRKNSNLKPRKFTPSPDFNPDSTEQHYTTYINTKHSKSSIKNGLNNLKSKNSNPNRNNPKTPIKNSNKRKRSLPIAKNSSQDDCLSS